MLAAKKLDDTYVRIFSALNNVSYVLNYLLLNYLLKIFVLL